MSKPWLILQTGDTPEGLTRPESFSGMFLRMADYHRRGAEAVDALRQPLPDPERFCAVIVTGSLAMVTDREPWSEACAAWLLRAMDTGLPLLGVCYGHQLLAQALGGVVDYHPQGLELGTHRVTLRPEARACPLFTGLPESFEANLSHSQTVITPPAPARVLGSSAHDPHQILLYGDKTLSLQFHPEFDLAVTRDCIDLELKRRRAAPAGQRPLNLGLPVKETPLAASLLQRFIDLTA